MTRPVDLGRHSRSRYTPPRSNRRKGGREPFCFSVNNWLPFSYLLLELSVNAVTNLATALMTRPVDLGRHSRSRYTPPRSNRRTGGRERIFVFLLTNVSPSPIS